MQIVTGIYHQREKRTERYKDGCKYVTTQMCRKNHNKSNPNIANSLLSLRRLNNYNNGTYLMLTFTNTYSSLNDWTRVVKKSRFLISFFFKKPNFQPITCMPSHIRQDYSATRYWDAV